MRLFGFPDFPTDEALTSPSMASDREVSPGPKFTPEVAAIRGGQIGEVSHHLYVDGYVCLEVKNCSVLCEGVDDVFDCIPKRYLFANEETGTNPVGEVTPHAKV